MFQFWHRYRAQRLLRAHVAPDSLGERFRWTWAVPAEIVRVVWLRLRGLLDPFITRRRAFGDLILGLPAIIAVVVIGTVTALGHQRQLDSGPTYLRAGLLELNDENPGRAKVLLQKAMLSDPLSRRDAMFYLARCYEELKQFDRSDSLMASLAPLGDTGHPGAHRYLALRMTDELQTKPDQVDLKAWLWHLQQADETNTAPVQTAWGTYHAYTGQLEKALTHFRSAAEKDPTAWFQVAELELRLNDVAAFRRSLTLARQRLEPKFREQPEDSRTRVLYATSLFQTGDLAAAETVLLEGLALGKATPEEERAFRQLLSAVFVRVHDLTMEGNGDVAESLRFLEFALNYNPDSEAALSRLARLARSSPEIVDQIRDSMRTLIAAGQGSALAHFTLGTIEWIAGNQELAALNMRQGLAIDPKMHVLANNLSYMIAGESDADLEVALKLADQAVEAAPQLHQYWDTRATVLAKMGRLQEAAVDFQKALELTDRPREYQDKLADIYERLGDPELAARFRQAATAAAENPAKTATPD